MADNEKWRWTLYNAQEDLKGVLATYHQFLTGEQKVKEKAWAVDFDTETKKKKAAKKPTAKKEVNNQKDKIKAAKEALADAKKNKNDALIPILEGAVADAETILVRLDSQVKARIKNVLRKKGNEALDDRWHRATGAARKKIEEEAYDLYVKGRQKTGVQYRETPPNVLKHRNALAKVLREIEEEMNRYESLSKEDRTAKTPYWNQRGK